jgi:hypothetical protein
VGAGVQVRPAARKLSDADGETARELYASVAAGNAVVVRRLLAKRGVVVTERMVQRAVADLRREQRAAPFATVRVETAPGDQAADRFRSETGLHCRHARPHLSPRRGAQLLASPVRETVAQ